MLATIHDYPEDRRGSTEHSSAKLGSQSNTSSRSLRKRTTVGKLHDPSSFPSLLRARILIAAGLTCPAPGRLGGPPCHGAFGGASFDAGLRRTASTGRSKSLLVCTLQRTTPLNVSRGKVFWTRPSLLGLCGGVAHGDRYVACGACDIAGRVTSRDMQCRLNTRNGSVGSFRLLKLIHTQCFRLGLCSDHRRIREIRQVAHHIRIDSCS